MPLIVYLDEAGDESIPSSDPQFPVFGLAMLVFDLDVYIEQVVPAIHRLKFDTWGHESIVLHSRDIRKAIGDHKFLQNAAKRPEFYSRINAIMGNLPYRIIPVVIRKNLVDPSEAMNIYDLALTMALEGLMPIVEASDQIEVVIIAEARGISADSAAASAFQKTLKAGTENISAERFRRASFRLVFIEKKMNVAGTQMADLAIYPISRLVLDPTKPNPSYEVIRPKLPAGGIRIYPE